MDIIRSIDEMQARIRDLKSEGHSIGFVPTMGYLHYGHLSLVDEAKKHVDIVVVSIYVNPTQFGPGEDLATYPRDFDRDHELCRERKVDIIFYPDNKQMYPEGYATYVEVEKLTKHLCGARRPSHFRGVTTIVTKLFNIIDPDIAVFGQKDGQQALVIKRMVRDLNMSVKIIVAPTFREKDGLAMSSRNKYLTSEQREYAPLLYHSLQLAEYIIKVDGWRETWKIIDEMSKLFQNIPDMRVDYISIVDTESIQPVAMIEGEVMVAIAIFLGKARLIDNIIVDPTKS